MSWRVLANSLRVVSAKRGNPPLVTLKLLKFLIEICQHVYRNVYLELWTELKLTFTNNINHSRHFIK